MKQVLFFYILIGFLCLGCNGSRKANIPCVIFENPLDTLLSDDVFHTILADAQFKLNRARGANFTKSLDILDICDSVYVDCFSDKIIEKYILKSIQKHSIVSPWDAVAIDPHDGRALARLSSNRSGQGDVSLKNHSIGSSVFAFLYATAISQQGISPCFEVFDIPVTIPSGYNGFANKKNITIKGKTGKRVNLKVALKNQIKSTPLYIMKQMGDTEIFRGQLMKIGIDSSIQNNGLYKVQKGDPLICLGNFSSNLEEITRAYSIFANDGLFIQPAKYQVSKICLKNKEVISFPCNFEDTQALPKNVNYAVLHMLRENLAGDIQLKTLKSSLAGFQGTSYDNKESWFLGISPTVVIGIWIGTSDNKSNGVQNQKIVKSIFYDIISNLEKDTTSSYDFTQKFIKPIGDLGIDLDCKQLEVNYMNEDFESNIFEDGKR